MPSVYLGGIIDFSQLSTWLSGPANPGNQVGLYLHSTAVQDDFLAGVGSQTAANFGGIASGEAELGLVPNPSTEFLGWYKAVYLQDGLSAAYANVVGFDVASTPIAEWTGFVQAANSVGISSVAPIFSPNSNSFSLTDFATNPAYETLREAALAGGALAVDTPPAYFSYRGAAYQEFTEQEITWAESQGLRATVIVAPLNDAATFLADTQALVRTLVDAGAAPTQWVVEDYDPGDTTSPATLEATAQWIAADPANTAASTTASLVAATPLQILSMSPASSTVAPAIAPVAAGPVAAAVTMTATASGYTFVTPSGGQSVVTGSGGTDTVLSQGTDTVNAAGSTLVYASGPAATVNGGAGGLTFVAGTGSYVAGGGSGVDVLFGGAGSSTLTGGSGATSFIMAAGGNTTLAGGSGQAAVMFGGTGADTFGGSSGGGDTMVGGSGTNLFQLTNADVAFGGTGTGDSVEGGSGATLLVEGSAPTQVSLGGGTVTAFAGTGADSYVVTWGEAGSAQIVGFKPSDQIELQGGFTAKDVADALHGAVTGSFGTVLTLTNGTSVTLYGAGVSAGQLVLA